MFLIFVLDWILNYGCLVLLVLLFSFTVVLLMTDYQGLIKIKWLKINFQLSIFEEEINWTTESYEQYNWDEELAWCLTGKADSGVHIIVPLHQESPGSYRLGRLISLNDDSAQAFLSLDSRGYKATKFDL